MKSTWINPFRKEIDERKAEIMDGVTFAAELDSVNGASRYMRQLAADFLSVTVEINAIMSARGSVSDDLKISSCAMSEIINAK